MKNFHIVGAVAVLFLLIFSTADARTVVRSGDTVSIAEEQVVQGDLYIAAGDVSISGDIEEEVIAAAGEITINGSIKSNAFIVAGVADIYGPIGDDLRIIAGEVTIAEPVTGDVFVMGGTLEILSTASVTGDVLVYAGDVVIEGSVGGDILGNVGTLRVDAAVAGDIDVTVSQLTLGDRATVDGSVRYISATELVQALNATVTGDLLRTEPVLSVTPTDRFGWLVPSFILLFSGLAWYLVSRKTLTMVVQRTVVKSPRPILIGLVALVVTPIAVVILLSSLIGSILAGVLFAAYCLALLLSMIVIMPVLGKLLFAAFAKMSPQVTLVSLVIGAVGFVALSALPVIGQTLLFIVMIMSLGALIDIIIRPSATK
jgi:cytoskeletal protein CcmA (bactofilin family)